MTIPISPSSLVLVGILPSPRDLEIAKLLGWYRIPLRFAPKIIDVDFLAFYQPSAFGDGHQWQIEYYSEVLGNELTTRAELFRDQTDHPRARDEYYKIQIGALQELPNPISAENWRRFTFLYTTGAHLLAAKTLHDLTVRDEERDVLWKALRDHAQNLSNYRSGSELPFNLDPDLLPFINGLSYGKSHIPDPSISDQEYGAELT